MLNADDFFTLGPYHLNSRSTISVVSRLIKEIHKYGSLKMAEEKPLLVQSFCGKKSVNQTNCNGFRLRKLSLITYQKSQKIPKDEVAIKRDLLRGSQSPVLLQTWERG